jgi:hypothetical protein
MLKTRIQICIIYSISYLFTIKEKRLKNGLPNKCRFRPFSSLAGSRGGGETGSGVSGTRRVRHARPSEACFLCPSKPITTRVTLSPHVRFQMLRSHTCIFSHGRRPGFRPETEPVLGLPNEPLGYKFGSIFLP